MLEVSSQYSEALRRGCSKRLHYSYYQALLLLFLRLNRITEREFNIPANRAALAELSLLPSYPSRRTRKGPDRRWHPGSVEPILPPLRMLNLCSFYNYRLIIIRTSKEQMLRLAVAPSYRSQSVNYQVALLLPQYVCRRLEHILLVHYQDAGLQPFLRFHLRVL